MQFRTQFSFGFLLQIERFLMTRYLQYSHSGVEQRRAHMGMQFQLLNRTGASLTSQIEIGRVKPVNDKTETTLDASVRLNL